MSESPESKTSQNASRAGLWVRFSRARQELYADFPEILRGGVPPKAFLTPEGCRFWYNQYLTACYTFDSLALLRALNAWRHDDVDFTVYLLHIFAEWWLRHARELVDLSDLIWPTGADKKIWLYEVEAGLVGVRTYMIGRFRGLAGHLEGLMESMGAVPTSEESLSAPEGEPTVGGPVAQTAESWHTKLRQARLKSGLSRRGAATSLKRAGIQITEDAIKKHEEGAVTPRREVRTGYAQIYATSEGALFPSAE
jgi:hypothetical protein